MSLVCAYGEEVAALGMHRAACRYWLPQTQGCCSLHQALSTHPSPAASPQAQGTARQLHCLWFSPATKFFR